MNADALRLMIFTAASNLKQPHHRRSSPPNLRCVDRRPLTPATRRCPPCKRFSPLLIDFYNVCKEELEIVFVSSDRDDRSFGDYFAKMPWLAMIPAYTNIEQNARQAKLADAFKVQVRF
jgi:hypothetical protein